MKKLLIASVALLTLASCAKTGTNASAQATQTTATTSTAVSSTNLPPGHPDLSNMPREMAAAGAGNVINGKVLETMNAGGYTYIKVAGQSGEVWAAVPQTKVTVGQTVAVQPQMTMDGFESKSLNRKFDHIIFGSLGGGPAPAGMPGAPMMQGAAQHMAGPADAGPISVPKIEGGQTVAELWASKAVLKGKPVLVRGKVVKSLNQIMGKNWIHIRDGSGVRGNGTDDITVTTLDRAAVGDVVVVRGTLGTDRDLGAGYMYPVIVEDAKVTKQ